MRNQVGIGIRSSRKKNVIYFVKASRRTVSTFDLPRSNFFSTIKAKKEPDILEEHGRTNPGGATDNKAPVRLTLYLAPHVVSATQLFLNEGDRHIESVAGRWRSPAQPVSSAKYSKCPDPNIRGRQRAVRRSAGLCDAAMAITGGRSTW